MWRSGDLYPGHIPGRPSSPGPFPPATIPPTSRVHPETQAAMPSDSVAGFLDHAVANRVLSAEQVAQLVRQPDFPQDDVAAVGDYLQRRGTISRYVSEMLRDRRGPELT